ncbi:MAG: acetolactate synthase small subunit, partial [Sedimentisphaerales bacterium]|nr:acetolactate synthase small subunit [Sedimentisphaerales bacterium]
MKHLISALVENKPGVLAHIAGMFAARAFNIDSLVVGRTEDPKLSRMTIVVVGDDKVVEQVRKQLAKVVPVVKVQDFAGQPVVARDLMLVSVTAPPEKRPEIVSLIEMFRGKVVDIGQKSLMIEVSGPES